MATTTEMLTTEYALYLKESEQRCEDEAQKWSRSNAENARTNFALWRGQALAYGAALTELRLRLGQIPFRGNDIGS